MDKPKQQHRTHRLLCLHQVLEIYFDHDSCKIQYLPSPGVMAPCDRTFAILKFDVTEETGPTGDNPGIEVLNTNLNKIIINKQ